MSNDLHDQIMNLPCKRTMSHFATKADLIHYKEGHRDARHAAAELALATPPVASGVLPELPYEDYIEGHHGDLASGYTADQMRAYGQACAAAAAPNAALVEACTEGSQVNLPDFMDWLADRLEYVYNESPNMDFVRTCRDRAKKVRAALAQAGAA